jgi:sarcosine oxidase
MAAYDLVVLGLGAMGSAAAYHAARRGQRVLGLDAHDRRHTLGSSHGRSRMIREAYYEAPEYVPLVRRAYALWRELEADSGRSLLTITGGLYFGPPESGLVNGVLRSAREHDLAHDILRPAEVAARFPAFRLADDQAAVYEANAGILEPEACVEAHLDLAARHGAELHHSEPAQRWAADDSGVRVETERGGYTAGRLVIAAGPWTSELLSELDLPLVVWRLVNAHFEPTRPEPFGPDRCPVYLWQGPEGVYGGFPSLPGQGVKFGRHDVGEVCTPRTIRREIEDGEIEGLRDVLERYLPGAAGPLKWAFTCMYTMTPDHHFILDRHPRHERVVYACGFSGHGFKFASVIGEVLTDLLIDGRTRHPIDFLSAARFAAPTLPR